MQSVSLRIWTHVAMSISYDGNDYTTGTSMLMHQHVNAPTTVILPTSTSTFHSLKGCRLTCTKLLQNFWKKHYEIFFIIKAVLAKSPCGVATNVLNCKIIVNMSSDSITIILTFGLKPLENVWTSIGIRVSVCYWSGRLGFNPTLSHTKDSKNGTCLFNNQHYKVRVSGAIQRKE